MLAARTMILLAAFLVVGSAAAAPGNWTEVFPEINLETTPLEIKTNSTIGSRDIVYVRFYTLGGRFYTLDAGGVNIYFYSTIQYTIRDCTYYRRDFPVSLPTDVEKVWRISLDRSSGVRLLIHCNDVEVLNILMSDTCHDSYWSHSWRKDVRRVWFDPLWDTSSDYYRLRAEQQGNWMKVFPERNLETTPLEIKTNSAIGSRDRVDVEFYTSGVHHKIGSVKIKFTSPPQYYIGSCTRSHTNFPVSLPTDAEKVWRISLDRSSGYRRLLIHCNDVEVLNILMFLECDSYWINDWNSDVGIVSFDRTWDTASDYYRAEQQFTVKQ